MDSKGPLKIQWIGRVCWAEILGSPLTSIKLDKLFFYQNLLKFGEFVKIIEVFSSSLYKQRDPTL